jgi:hypothetical protein
MSSLDSTTSEESSIPTPHFHGSVSSLTSGHGGLKDHYGSITSLASSTSMISPQVRPIIAGVALHTTGPLCAGTAATETHKWAELWRMDGATGPGGRGREL